MKLRVVCAAVAGLLVLAAPSLAATQSAKLGSVRATVTYTQNTRTDLYSGMQLLITRDGRQAYDAPVDRLLCGTICGPLTTRGTVKVLKLDGSREPNVLLRLYSGGAHCCEIDQVFTYAHGTYTRAQYDFGNYGERLVKLGGTWVFETADNAFAYAFTDFAASGAPVQLLRFGGGRFTDVTRSYPAVVTKDAAVWMKAFTQQAPDYTDTTGVVAAWAADEDLLGNAATVSSFLATQAGEKHLNTPLSGLPKNAKYVAALDKFLKKLGYLS